MNFHPYKPCLSNVIIAILIFIISTGIRIHYYDGKPFWLDEMWRANLILDSNYLNQYWPNPNSFASITSLPYLYINKFISIFSPTPYALRLSSLIPGIFVPVVAFFIIVRTTNSKILATTCALIFCINPNFIRYSNELKPFMLELLIHLLIFYFFIIYTKKNDYKYSSLLLVLMLLSLGLILGPNFVITYPVYIILTLYTSYINKFSNLNTIILFIIFNLVTIGLMYAFLWSKVLLNTGLFFYWSNGFKNENENYFIFILKGISGLYEGAFWELGILGFMVSLILLTLNLLHNVFIRNSQLNLFSFNRNLILPFFALLLAIIIVFVNYLRFWPLGDLRTNQFLFGYIIILFFLLLNNKLRSINTIFLACIMTALFITALYFTFYSKPRLFSPPLEQSEKVWNDLNKVITTQISKENSCLSANHLHIFLNPGMSFAYEYNLRIAKVNSTNLNEKMERSCLTIETVPDVHDNFNKFSESVSKYKSGFFIFAYSAQNKEQSDLLKKYAAEYGQVKTHTTYQASGLIIIER